MLASDALRSKPQCTHSTCNVRRQRQDDDLLRSRGRCIIFAFVGVLIQLAP